MSRCKHCSMPLTDLSGLIARVTALLDMEVPFENAAPPMALEETRADLYARTVRMGTAQFFATEALALSHGYCGALCALAAKPKTQERPAH